MTVHGEDGGGTIVLLSGKAKKAEAELNEGAPEGTTVIVRTGSILHKEI